MNRGRRKKRRFRLRHVLVLALIAGAVLFTWSPAFRVQTVEVRGSQLIAGETIIASAKVTAGSHMWFDVDLDELAHRVLESTRVFESVVVTRALPGKLVIAVSESVPVARIEAGRDMWLVSEYGVVLARAGRSSLPVIEFDGTGVDVGSFLGDQYGAALAVAGGLRELGITDIDTINVAGIDKVIMWTGCGIEVVMGNVGDDVGDRLQVLPYIIDDALRLAVEIEYIDITFPGQPLIRTVSEEEAE